LSPFKPYLGEGGDRGRKQDLRTAGIFFFLALLLTFLPPAYREAIAAGVRGTVLRPVLAMQQGAVERETRFADPERLRAERDSLAVYLVGHSTLAAENRQLRSLLGLQQRLPPSFVPAQVMRVPGRGYEGFFLLTAGRQQGLLANAPIVAAGGLVGMVRNVDENMSMAIDWTHSDFRASAMTVDGETYGIVSADTRPGGEPRLLLTGTAFHAELAEGTVIVTSGRGGVYPRGVPIGMVAGMVEQTEQWQRSYLLQPFVAPGEMTHVMVLAEPGAVADRDLAIAWGIRPPEPEPIDTVAPPPPPQPRALLPTVRQPQPRVAVPQPAPPRILGTPIQPQTTPVAPPPGTQP
jgi:cell shape-determining protein MreC